MNINVIFMQQKITELEGNVQLTKSEVNFY